MLGFVRRMFGGEDPHEPRGLAGLAHASAGRFAAWIAENEKRACPVSVEGAGAVDAALDRARSGRPTGTPLPEGIGADAASWVGEVVRTAWGGEWTEDPRFGIVLKGTGRLDACRFMPLALVEKKWRRSPAFSLEAFLGTLDKRFEAERSKAEPASPPAEPGPAPVDPPNAMQVAQAECEAFRTFWKRRFGVALPLTLTGVREVDGFLRSHYYVCCIEDRRLVQAGFFLGEVGRGLFGGGWVLPPDGEPGAAALQFPELDYLPVGRIFKMMTTHPDGEPLDEYIRLIPSARNEMRKQGLAKPGQAG